MLQRLVGYSTPLNTQQCVYFKVFKIFIYDNNIIFTQGQLKHACQTIMRYGLTDCQIKEYGGRPKGLSCICLVDCESHRSILCMV